MKKNKLLFAALLALVTFGFVLVACGDGYTPPNFSGGGGNESNNIERLEDDADTTAVMAKIQEVATVIGTSSLGASAATEFGTKAATKTGAAQITWINEIIELINDDDWDAVGEKLEEDD